MIALLFPGQGAQQVGMGRELAAAFPVAAATFEEANDALGYDITRTIFEGPEEALVRTDVCQPAILTMSIACLRVASDHGLTADLALGHSLGEFSALVACGSIDFADALRLVGERGAAMQAAGEARPGTMAAILGQSDVDADALCAEVADVWPANYNSPGQVVASGTFAGIDRLLAITSERRIKAERLTVGGAFHSPLMAPASDRLAPALEAWTPTDPNRLFLSTTTAQVEPTDRMRPVLLEQLTSPVRFRQAVETAVAMGVDRFVELGPGRVLSGLVKRIHRDATLHQVSGAADLAAITGVVA
ncbi:MAG: [acyl-carrier-protein] S-malonyltransferase [Thermoleophilia bacterium]|nr:[acyl-carrier-protein] S-malonyltransferase [Thermoleophilia bacterium]